MLKALWIARLLRRLAERLIIALDARDLRSAMAVQSKLNYSARERAIGYTTLVIGNT